MEQQYNYEKMRENFLQQSPEEIKQEATEALITSSLISRMLGFVLKNEKATNFKYNFPEFEDMNTAIGDFLFKLMDGTHNLPQYISNLESAKSYTEQQRCIEGIASELAMYYQAYFEFRNLFFKHPMLQPFQSDFFEKLSIPKESIVH
ncbi:TPA: hypothetical protein QCY38_003631 [Bacillus toyonensis]|uniref:hypothetical protein n=1 Tax=Bacillus paramycoides TaxID=2026194 RepID=UPI002E1BC2F8|nr:hypothetical protein [Bacillus paramycoides]HDR7949944.1 hypothetical protein [Bacillus toyonensis]